MTEGSVLGTARSESNSYKVNDYCCYVDHFRHWITHCFYLYNQKDSSSNKSELDYESGQIKT